MASLPVFDPATPKVSILAIGMQTLDSANELVAEAGQQAAKFQVQATDKTDFMLEAYNKVMFKKQGGRPPPDAVNSCHAHTHSIRTQRVPTSVIPLRVPTCVCDNAVLSYAIRQLTLTLTLTTAG